MKTKWSNIFEAAILSGTLVSAGAACGDDDGTDAGCPGPADAGCPGPADAGCPGADAACPGADAGCPGSSAVPSDPAMFTAWLATDAFRGEGWHCDASIHEPEPGLMGSPHGMHEICVNDLLYDERAGSAAFPVGAAAVKVTYGEGGAISGRFLEAKLRAGDGAATWYFHAPGGSPAGYGDSAETAFCATCHATGHDYVRRVPE